MKYAIVEFALQYQQQVIDLILPIQQKEFNLPITLDDQPDLKTIGSVYQKGYGNFWVALSGKNVVGTIALIDFGNWQSALRKMFVHPKHRGKDAGVAQLLMDELIAWCTKKNVKEIYLGTIDSMHAAHRFYIKNSFTEIQKEDLPKSFPLVRVDNRFFSLKF
ncbi:MAG: GNAT family N-acetyltransferase [Bacteroidetes bacterium]|nr:GNAT family N-acetyltransferase [Bacteroidota bacterium]